MPINTALIIPLYKTCGGFSGTTVADLLAIAGSLPVEDEGVPVVAAPTALNFVGAGVSVVDNAGVADITIPVSSLALDDLTDVTLTAPATGNVLFKSAGNWLNTDAIFIDPAGAVTLDFNDLAAFQTIGDNRFGIGADLAIEGASALARTMNGLELTSKEMNATSKFTPPLKFMSTDSAFTTENPKFLAGIMGVATETYNADTKGGMELQFFTTPNTPGVTSIPVLALRLLSNQNAIFVANVEIDGALNHDGTTVGFYGTTPITLQTGVAVTAAAIHAALVNLGLITA